MLEDHRDLRKLTGDHLLEHLHKCSIKMNKIEKKRFSAVKFAVQVT